MLTIYKYPIYKYPINATGINRIKMPAGAKLLSADRDASEQICVWAIVDTDVREMEEHKIIGLGTGWPVPELNDRWHYRFIDTIVEQEYGLVWHIFEILEDNK